MFTYDFDDAQELITFLHIVIISVHAKWNFKWIGNFVVISKTVIFISTSHTQQWFFFIFLFYGISQIIYMAFEFS